MRSERRRKELIEVEKELDDTKEELRELASKLKTQVVVKGDKYHEVNAKIHWVAGKYGVILEGDVINPKKPQAP